MSPLRLLKLDPYFGLGKLAAALTMAGLGVSAWLDINWVFHIIPCLVTHCSECLFMFSSWLSRHEEGDI